MSFDSTIRDIDKLMAMTIKTIDSTIFLRTTIEIADSIYCIPLIVRTD